MYVVYVDGLKMKVYPYRIQAIIWAFLHGYVYTGWDEWKAPYTSIYVFDSRLEIRKERLCNEN